MKNTPRHASLSHWSICLATYAVCAGCCAYAGAPAVESATEEEAEEFANWVDLTVGGFDINGKDSAFQRRWNNNGDFFGGVESMRYEKTFDNGTFLLEGHALFGLEDYDITLGYDLNDVGYLRGGYREFRTWYDTAGGYLPGVPGGWRSPNDQSLELDRGELWFEAGLRMPDIPEITLYYAHQWRDGEKDSTIWGDVYSAGLRRGIFPGLYDIDETRDIVSLDATHTLGNTDLELGLRYESVRNDNTRSTVTGDATDTVFTRLSQREVYEYDLFGGHITSETRFNDRMLLSFGYAVTTMDTDVDGGQRGNTALATGVFTPVYQLLTGSGDFVQNTANLNFWWNPVDDLVVVPSIRANWEEIDMRATRFDTAAAANTGTPSSIRTNSDDLQDISESLEVRYTGIPDLVLYAKGDWTQGDADRWLRNPVNGQFRYSETDLEDAKYSVGANWYPVSGLSFAAQYYYRSFEEDYDVRLQGTNFDAQFDYHAADTNDFNIRMTWRAMPNLTFVTRYDYQQTDIENRAFTDAAAAVVTRTADAADIESNIISQSATWNATERFYLQGSVHWISSETTTPSNNFQPNYHVNWDNDYWSAALSAGYVINKNTDIKASYYYFKADNYVNNTAQTVPYGIMSEEHAFTVALTQWVTPRVAWNVRYGFFKGEDDAYGGFNDYDAHMVSTGLQVRF
jgi:hypothetical protein